MSDGGTQEDRVSALLDMRVQAVRLEMRQIPFPFRLSCDGEGNIVPKFLIPHCQEKPLVRIRCPYRKPTQVGEERILR